MGSTSPNTILRLYGELGYLRAHTDPEYVRLLNSKYQLPSQDVSVTVPVHEGVSYHWKGDDWSGNHAFPSGALDKLLGMHPEAVANLRKYDNGMKAVRDAYSKQGYLQLAISAHQDLDDAARQVTYHFSVVEGPQFHMGVLTITGLAENMTRRISKEWKLHQGDVYDGTYLTQFLKQALPGLYQSGMRVNYPTANTYTDTDKNTVNVEIAFH